MRFLPTVKALIADVNKDLNFTSTRLSLLTENNSWIQDIHFEEIRVLQFPNFPELVC